MANAKANIYPVQLQGAELNLNKYDAEIKKTALFYRAVIGEMFLIGFLDLI